MNSRPELPELAPKHLFTVRDTLKLLGISRSTLARHSQTGAIIATYRGCHVYYLGKDITKYYYSH